MPVVRHFGSGGGSIYFDLTTIFSAIGVMLLLALGAVLICCGVERVRARRGQYREGGEMLMDDRKRRLLLMGDSLTGKVRRTLAVLMLFLVVGLLPLRERLWPGVLVGDGADG